ncbi:MAG: hypothetical protein ABR586_03235 [Thermoplasmatota archaeon]
MGQILAFAIVAGVFVLSMLAFQKASEQASDRVVQIRADSTAARIASVIVQSGLIMEEQGSSVRVRFLIDLPQEIERRDYEVELHVPAAGETATVVVTVPSRDITATAPLMAIEASSGITVCPGTVPGGHMYARYGEPAGSPGNPCLFLEAAP